MNIEETIKSAPLVKIFLTLAITTLIIAILPDTPFMQYLEEINDLPFLPYINWLIPFDKMAGVMSAWWTAVVVYYGVRWILSQLGHVGGGN